MLFYIRTCTQAELITAMHIHVHVQVTKIDVSCTEGLFTSSCTCTILIFDSVCLRSWTVFPVMDII